MKARARNFRREWLKAIWLAAVFTFLVLVATGNFAQAQETAAQGTMMAPIQIVSEPKKSALSVRLNVDAASSLHKESSYERKTETSLELAPTVRLSDRLSLSAVAGLAREFDAAATTTLSNTKFSLSHSSLLLGKLGRLGPSISATLPTNKFAVDQDTYRGAVGGGVSLVNDLQSYRLPIVVGLRFGYDRNFHELTLSADSGANIRDRIREGLNLRWIIGSRWSFSFDALASQAWTYRSTVRNRFDLSEEIGFDVNSKITLYLAHSNGGNAVKANGRESNIALFDANASVVHAGATYVF